MAASELKWWEKHDEDDFSGFDPYSLTAIGMEWLDDVGRESIDRSAPHSLQRAQALAAWLEHQYAFRMMADCMTSMVERLLEPTPSNDFWKIWVVCGSPATQTIRVTEPGELVVQLDYDPSALLHASDLERKRALIDLIEAASQVAERQSSTDLSNLREACAEVREQEYQNEWIWGEAVSPNGRIARIVVSHDTISLKIYALIFESDGTLITRKLLIDERPYGSDVWHRHLGDIRWDSEERAVFVNNHDGRELYIDI